MTNATVAMRSYHRTIGIDYSGAETPGSSLKGLRVYATEGDAMAVEILPPPSPRKYWTRRGLAEWLAVQLHDGPPTIVGIDHAFSFPLRFFEVYGLPPDWPLFLEDFHQHWPTDADHMYVDFIRIGAHGNGAARTGNTRWRRVTEQRAGGAKSVFHFDVPGSVAKSTHAGIPWLRFLRQHLARMFHQVAPAHGRSPSAMRAASVFVVRATLVGRGYAGLRGAAPASLRSSARRCQRASAAPLSHNLARAGAAQFPRP